MDAAPDISRSRIFDGLTDDGRRAFLAAGRRRILGRQHTLARQGEVARAFYLVESGTLKLLQVTAEGEELIVRFVGEQDPFGGVAALSAAAYPVTAVAVESTHVIEWPAAVMGPLLDRYPQVRLNIMREMTAHMTDALTRVRELSTKRVGQRLAHALLRLARQGGRKTERGVLISYPLTRQELAQLTGATLFTISRTLSEWESAGIVRSEGRRLLIVTPARLDALADGLP